MKGKANTALPWMEKGDTHSMNYVYRGLANTYLETMKTLRSLKHGQVRSEISAENYESNCYKLFGDQWNDVFDELVATFPDKQGQDDLIKAHQNRVIQPIKKSKAKKHNNYRPLTAWGPGNMVGNRMDDDLYPPLSSTALVQPPPAKWGHKVAVK